MSDARPPVGPDAPVSVTGRSSAADASQPDGAFDQSYHTYESNPVPWWLTMIWLSFLIFGFVYLLVSLME